MPSTMSLTPLPLLGQTPDSPPQPQPQPLEQPGSFRGPAVGVDCRSSTHSGLCDDEDEEVADVKKLPEEELDSEVPLK